MKKIFFLVLIIVMTFSMVATANGDIAFNDVSDDYWAADEIQYFAANNIVNGVGDGLFEPESKVTREQLCKIMVLTFNTSLDDGGEQIFADVEADRWSFAYINKCKDFLTGYINPFGGLPSFKPEAYATREDIAVALVRMMGISEPEVIFEYFADEEEFSPSLRKYIWIAHQYGLINGYPDGTFRPKNGVTRAEAVVLMDRATKQALSDFTDELFIEVSEHEAYEKSKDYVAIVVKSNVYANVTVDGTAVDMGPYGVGGCHVYFNNNEVEKVITATASRYGKSIAKEFTIKKSWQTQGKINNPDIPEKTMLEMLSDLLSELTTVSLDLSYPEISTTDTAVITGTVNDSGGKAVDVKVILRNDIIFINNETVLLKNGEAFSITVKLLPGENVFLIEAYSDTSHIFYDSITIMYETDEAFFE